MTHTYTNTSSRFPKDVLSSPSILGMESLVSFHPSSMEREKRDRTENETLLE